MNVSEIYTLIIVVNIIILQTYATGKHTLIQNLNLGLTDKKKIIVHGKLHPSLYEYIYAIIIDN